MAKIAALKVVIDAVEAEQGARKVQAAAKAIISETAKMTKALVDSAKGYRVINEAINVTKTNLFIYKETLKVFPEAYKQMKEGAEAAAEATKNKFGKAVAWTNTKLETLVEATKKLGAAYSSETKKFNELGVGFDKIGEKAKALHGVFGGLGLAITSAFALKKTINTLRDFDQEMQFFAAVSGSTGRELERITASVREMGAVSRFGATQAASALVELAKAGFTTQEAMAALPGTLNLAINAMVDMGTAADITVNVMRQFNLSAEETSRVIDILTHTAFSTTTNLTNLASSLKFVGPVAANLNIDIETTAAALGILANRGLRASLAGTNLRGVLFSLVDVTKQGADTIGEMGLTIDETDPSLNNLIDLFERLGDAQLDATDANAIFERRMASAAIILATMSDEFRQLAQENAEATNRALEAAKVIDDSLNGSMKRFSAAVQEAILKTGDSGLAGAFRSLIETARGVILEFVGMDRAYAGISTTSLMVANAIRGATVVFTALVGVKILTWAINAKFGLIALASAIETLEIIALTSTGALGLFGIAIGTLATAAWALAPAITEAERKIDDLQRSTIDLIPHVEDLELAFTRMSRVQSAGDVQGITRELQTQLAVMTRMVDQAKTAEKQLQEAFKAAQERQGDISRGIGNEFGLETEIAPNIKDFTQQGITKGILLALTRGSEAGAKLKETLKDLEDTDIVPMFDDGAGAVGIMEEAMKHLREQIIRLTVETEEARRVELLTDQEVRTIERAKVKLEEMIDTLQFENRVANQTAEVQERLTAAREADRLAAEARKTGAERLAIQAMVIAMVKWRQEIEAVQAAEEEAAKTRKSALKDLEEWIEKIQINTEALNRGKEQGEAFELMQEGMAAAMKAGSGNLVIQHTMLQALVKRYIEAKAAAQGLKDAEADRERELKKRLREEERAAKNRIEATRDAKRVLEDIRFETELLQLNNEERERAIILRQLEDTALRGEVEGMAALRAELQGLITDFQDTARINEVAEGISDSFGRAFEDIVLGFESVEDALENLAKNVQQILLRELFTIPFTQTLKTSLQSILPGLIPSADGNAFNRGSVIPFANGGVLSSPTFFPLANNKVGLGGEAGPEAIMPLKRTKGGKLGIEATGMGAQTIVNYRQTVVTPNADSFKRSSRQIYANFNKGRWG